MISHAEICKVNEYGYERNYRHNKMSLIGMENAKKESMFGKKIHI